MSVTFAPLIVPAIVNVTADPPQP